MSTTAGHNPYEPPKADVVLPAPAVSENHLIDGGRTVAAGNGVSWIGDGWSLFAKSPGTWIGSILLLMILWIVVSLVPVVGGIAIQMLAPIVLGGLMLGCRSLDSGGDFRIDHLFAGFKDKAGPLAIVGLLMLIFSIVVVIVLGIIFVVMAGGAFLQTLGSGDPDAFRELMSEKGLMLFALFGLMALALFIPLSMAYWFAPALVVFHDMDSFQAMKQSFRGCLRNILPFLLYGLVFLVLFVVAAIPLFLGYLIVIPMIYTTLYSSYKDIYLDQSVKG